MTSTEKKITVAAAEQGFRAITEGSELVVLNTAGKVEASATIVSGRFYGGYVVDRIGHVVSHSTVKGMLAALADRA